MFATVICERFLEHQKITNFPFGTNGKLTVLGVSILRHIMFLFFFFFWGGGGGGGGGGRGGTLH